MSARAMTEAAALGVEQTRPVRQRLIDAAEQLFAEHGWATVSIRTIAAAADVSLAALNYHFGLKENLLAEIFAARARPIAEERCRRLNEVAQRADATLEDVLDAFLRPALMAGADNKSFARLRARLASEPEAFSRRILADAFDDSSRLCIECLAAKLPELPEQDLFWRFHFLLGTMVYTMADAGRIQSLTHGKCDPGDVEQALLHLVPFLAAGFRAEPPTSKNTSGEHDGHASEAAHGSADPRHPGKPGRSRRAVEKLGSVGAG